MSKGPFPLIVGVLLLIAALFNMGSGIAQYTKGSIVKGTTSAMAGIGAGVVRQDRNDAFAPLGNRLQQQSREIESHGASQGATLQLLAALILLTAVLQIVASVGLFSPKPWTSKMLMVAALAGAAVELIDMARGGVGGTEVVFLAIYGLAAYLALQGLSAVTAVQPLDVAAAATSSQVAGSSSEGTAVAKKAHLSPEASPSDPGSAPARMGACPNCLARLSLDSVACSDCKAEFGPGSRWQIQAR